MYESILKLNIVMKYFYMIIQIKYYIEMHEKLFQVSESGPNVHED